MKENVVAEKSFDFAVEIVGLAKILESKREYVFAKQILRSGTAVGALISESKYAESKPDFIHKLKIAIKEAHETEYWLKLLHKTEIIKKNTFEDLHRRITELLRLLTAIIKSTQQNHYKRKP